MTTDKTIEEMKRAIAEFMGWEFVTVGYFEQHVGEEDDETDWQVKNADWMDKVLLEDVGKYFVKVKEDQFIRASQLKYHKDWNQLHAVWDRYKKLTFADPKQEQLHSEMKSLISVAICYSDILHVHKLLYDSIVFFTTTKQKD